MARKFLCAISSELPPEILSEQINDAHTRVDAAICLKDYIKNNLWSEELEGLRVILNQAYRRHRRKSEGGAYE
jgi:hypothetical protein